MAEKGSYYQLLGVGADAGKSEIRDGFYMLARKFHPDRHMDKHEWVAPLQQLMGAITEAYRVLSDEKKRGSYDRKQTTLARVLLRLIEPDSGKLLVEGRDFLAAQVRQPGSGRGEISRVAGGQPGDGDTSPARGDTALRESH